MNRGDKSVKSVSLSERAIKHIQEMSPNNFSGYVNELILLDWFKKNKQMAARAMKSKAQHKIQMFGED
jgi:hypothetical protein